MSTNGIFGVMYRALDLFEGGFETVAWVNDTFEQSSGYEDDIDHHLDQADTDFLHGEELLREVGMIPTSHEDLVFCLLGEDLE